MRIWNKIVDFLVYGIDICRSTSRKISTFWNQNVSLPSTEKIKDTAYEYYDQVSNVDLPNLNILPELPEIPVQLKVSMVLSTLNILFSPHIIRSTCQPREPCLMSSGTSSTSQSLLSTTSCHPTPRR